MVSGGRLQDLGGFPAFVALKHVLQYNRQSAN